MVDVSSSGAINWIWALPTGRAAHRQHGLADALVVVDFLVQHDHAEVVVVPLDRHVEIGNRDADVVDCCHKRASKGRTGINLLGGHKANGNVY